MMASVSCLPHYTIAEIPSRQPQSSSPSAAPSCFCNVPRISYRQQPQQQLLFVGTKNSRRMRTAAVPPVIAVAVAAKSTDIPPTVAETKRAFLDAYKRPIPSIYSTVVQELLVQQHLLRYTATYQYDGVFGLGFVTVFDQLFDGYPSVDDRDAIFKAYIGALKEDPELYRKDATKLEEWAKQQSATSVVSFAERDGEGENLLKDISDRAGGKGNFHYSRFFAIGLFRILEIAKASDPGVLEQLAKAVNVNKLSIDRDLDVYRNLLSKLTQSKDLLKEYLDREKRRQAEREADKAAAAAKKEKSEAKSD